MDIAWRITGIVFFGLLFFMIIKFIFPLLTSVVGCLTAVFEHLAKIFSML